MDDSGVLLGDEDGDELKGNNGCSSDITLVGVEGVSDAGRGEEDDGDASCDLGAEASMLVSLVSTEDGSSSNEQEDNTVCVPEREGKVDKDCRNAVLGRVLSL